MGAVIFFAGVLSLGSTNCSKGVRVFDPMIALAANDYTALIEGCGRQLSDGFTVCRKTEGSAAGDFLTFVGPATECLGAEDEPCVTFEVFFPDGSPNYGGAIPRGATRQQVPWKELLRRETFQKDDRGFWAYRYTIRFLDSQGAEHRTYTMGELYLRVLAAGYQPAHSLAADPTYVWRWDELWGIPVRMSTGGRTYVGPDPKDGGQ